MAPTRIGWLTSVADRRVIAALEQCLAPAAADEAPMGAEIAAVVFGGDTIPTRLTTACRDRQVPVVHLPWARFDSGERFESAIAAAMATMDLDAGLLVGFRRILRHGLLESLPLVNIHPAVPGGPRGTEEEVIAALVAAGATHTGLTAHVVTAELDAGPVVATRTIAIPPTWPRRAAILDAVGAELGPFARETMRRMGCGALTGGADVHIAEVRDEGRP